jgi:3-deoxy-D-manno-octulosonic-acid transferase
VSVGEVNAAKSLINSLGKLSFELYLSTTTQTGHEHAKSLFPDRVQVFYFPLDWKVICRKYLNRIKPDIVLLVETEIWPNFIMSARDLTIPIVLVNGRISDQSLRRYSKVNFMVQPLLECFSHFCMQSQQDLQRVHLLGAPRDRLKCTGNLKFDYEATINPDQALLRRSVRGILTSLPEDLLLICGSTKPGEEEMLLSTFASLRPEFPHLKLLLAPRHPHRGDQISELVKERGFRCLQRSKDELNVDQRSPADVLVLDSIGELASLYELADLVFIGGSLVPMGGQNIIEAAACGRAILFGPHMDNFRQVASTFVAAGAAIQIPSSTELETQLRALIKDPERRSRLGRKALEVIRLNQGAVVQTVETIVRYLPQRNKTT